MISFVIPPTHLLTHALPLHMHKPHTHTLRLKILEIPIPLPPQLLRIRFPPLLFIWILIEALRIAFVPQRRYDRSPIFPVVNIFPHHASEERMVFNAGGAASDIAETVGSVDGAELPDDVFGFGGDGGLLREEDGFGYDSGWVSWFLGTLDKIGRMGRLHDVNRDRCRGGHLLSI